MIFESESAKREYLENPNISYRAIAEKYGVSLSKIKSIGAREGWFKKKSESKKAENESKKFDEMLEKAEEIANEKFCEKLSLLRKSANKTIEALYNSLLESGDMSFNDLKNVSTILKTLTAVQRDLNDLPTFKEENSLLISKERLKLVRDRISTDGEKESETGVVLIPFADEEEDDEAVFEGDEDA